MLALTFYVAGLESSFHKILTKNIVVPQIRTGNVIDYGQVCQNRIIIVFNFLLRYCYYRAVFLGVCSNIHCFSRGCW